MKQYEAVILTLEKLGGVATLGQLNQEVFKIKECEWKTKTPYASIRRIVQTNEKDIYKIKPGLYGLVKMKQENENKGIIIETEQNKDSKEIIEFNHSYYQGLILTIGNMRNLNTFIPNQDKNKSFLNKKLKDIRTLEQIPHFSYDFLVKRSETIDVIWFNHREMPNSFFEIEHSTDIQNSLLKYNDLQDFYTRMFIVSDNSRREEFNKKIKYSSFSDINERVEFIDYDSVVKLHEFESLRNERKISIF